VDVEVFVVFRCLPANHPGLYRLVFQFDGGLPARRDVRSVPAVIGDPSGLPVPVVGDALLQVRFEQATGHDENGQVTYGAVGRTYPLPALIQVVNSGDFEAVLSFGIGLSQRSTVQLSTLTNPARVVLDISTPAATVPVSDYFLDEPAFVAGREPYTRAVSRPVIAPAVARGALQRLFAGPTEAELVGGLRFVSSDATGFADLSISGGIARVRLTGGCSSHGSTFTIAGEIMPTLKQFPTVRWVKIYDPAGTTERPGRQQRLDPGVPGALICRRCPGPGGARAEARR